MMFRMLIVTTALMLANAAPVQAFDVLGTVIGAGVRVGAELGGAVIGKAVDSVKDALRDPEAEAAEQREQDRKMLETIAASQREIEAREGLTPLQRERLSMALMQQYEQVQIFRKRAEEMEALRRAQRDKLFTLGGVAGLAFDATLSSAPVAMAKADMMVKAGIPQAQGRSTISISGANAAPGNGLGNNPQLRAAVADGAAGAIKSAVNASVGAESTQQAHVANAVVDGVAGTINPAAAAPIDPLSRQDQAAEALGAVLPPLALPETQGGASPAAPGQALAPESGIAFTPDRGRKIHLEFAGSPTLTRKMRAALTQKGFDLVEQPEQAEVRYVIEGEFLVRKTNRHKRLQLDVGALLENPGQPVGHPEEILGAKIGGMLFGGAIGGPKVSGFQQEVLLVIARQKAGEPESRVAVTKRMRLEKIVAAPLARDAAEELFERLGLKVGLAPDSEKLAAVD